MNSVSDQVTSKLCGHDLSGQFLRTVAYFCTYHCFLGHTYYLVEHYSTLCTYHGSGYGY